jgi:hypothetical protein
MSGAAWNIQQGLYTYLNADTTLMGLAKKIWDGVPPGQYNGTLEPNNFPYVVIGDSIETPDDSHTRFGSVDTITLHVWSRHQGDKEIKEIMGRMWQMLHHQPWAIPNYSRVMSRIELTESLRDPDGITRHGVMRVRVLVQEVQ